MPHATNRYPFEWKIYSWAKDFSELLTGKPHYAFFISFTGDGLIQKIIVGNQAERFDCRQSEVLCKESSSWFFHDPFEGPEYTYIDWKNLDRKTMERIIGVKLEPEDFVNGFNSIEFPMTWGVMF